MSTKSDRRKKAQAEKAKRKASQLTPGKQSRYARKERYCFTTGTDPWKLLGVFPKPWN